jgi:hypothetical protein
MQFVQFTNEASLHVPAVLLRSSVNFVSLLMRTPTRPSAYSCPMYQVGVGVSYSSGIIL